MSTQFLWELTGKDGEQIETLRQGLVLFETVEMPARNLAAKTRKEYRNDLEDLIEFLEERDISRLEQVSLGHLKHYQAEMDRRGYSTSTRKRKTYAIKTFFRFLRKHGVISKNVAVELVPPRPRKNEPRYLSKGEYQRLLQVCRQSPRDAAIVELFLQTGMKLSELASLTLSDIGLPERVTDDPDNTGTVRVKRSSGRTETIPLNYKACKALRAWLREKPNVGHDALFVSKRKTPLSERAIQYMVKKYLDEAGIKDASVRTLRHTYGTHHALMGTDLKSIRETMGHRSPETAEVYRDLAKKEQRKALQEHAL